MNYKREYGEWDRVAVDKTETSYTLKNLWCGSRYQIYITAFNKIGAGEASPILTTKTKGYGKLFYIYLVYCISIKMLELFAMFYIFKI